MTLACGLDFGTSNSTAGYLVGGQAKLLPLEEGKPTLPSVVFFNADENHTRYGRLALAEYLEGYEGRLMRSLKSLLGSNLMDGRTEVNGVSLQFRDLLAQFIGELKLRAETAAGQTFERAVLGRPVYFVDDDPVADQLAQDTLADIARAVGFKEVAFQFEPIAAAFEYEAQIDQEELVLIVDIGGGTSDFSLVRLSPDRAGQLDRAADILANGGVHIGGTDFDRALALASAMPQLGYRSHLQSGIEMPSSYYFNLATWHTINFTYTRKVWAELQDVYRQAQDKAKVDRLLRLVERRAGHWLALQVEATKIALSGADVADLDMDELEAGLSHQVNRSEFDAAAEPLVARVEATLSELLIQAGLAAAQVDTVFFTGGASGVPLLRARLAGLLPNARQVEGDRFGSIGLGLARDAARRFG
jgi:hypothetical chaperone protein